MSSGSARNAGSISGSASGSGPASRTDPRLFGFKAQTWQVMPRPQLQLARVAFDHRDDEMELDVGLGEIGPCLEEAPGLGEIGGDHAAPFATIARDRR